MSPFLLSKFTEEETNDVLAKYLPLLKGMTDGEKEDKLIEFVSIGKLSADMALVISMREGLVG